MQGKSLVNQRLIVKFTVFAIIGLVSMGLLSKKSISLDYVIHQQSCQQLSVKAQKIELMDQLANRIICEDANRYFQCAHYDHLFNQLTEAKKFYKKHEFGNELHLSTRDNREKIVINFRSKHVASSQNNEKKEIGTKVCTGVLYDKEQLRERFPELIAGKR